MVGFAYANPTMFVKESLEAIALLLRFFCLCTFFLLFTFVFIFFPAFVSHGVSPFYVRLTRQFMKFAQT